MRLFRLIRTFRMSQPHNHSKQRMNWISKRNQVSQSVKIGVLICRFVCLSTLVTVPRIKQIKSVWRLVYGLITCGALANFFHASSWRPISWRLAALGMAQTWGALGHPWVPKKIRNHQLHSYLGKNQLVNRKDKKPLVPAGGFFRARLGRLCASLRWDHRLHLSIALHRTLLAAGGLLFANSLGVLWKTWAKGACPFGWIPAPWTPRWAGTW